ncbi:MAG: 5'/3'-nucleotidase SurE [Pseudanabaenaceae cyanobacterium]
MGIILLTNDDGVEGAGLWALQGVVVSLGYEDWAIVAPLVEQSGCGHQTTTSCPIPVHQRAEQVWGIGGTPADCTRIAVSELFPHRIDLVLSGINDGGNLGVDIYTSGTVAAAREACFRGIPAIAISHYKIKNKQMDWEWARHNTARVLSLLLAKPYTPNTFWNVNLPHCPEVPEPEIRFCRLSTDPLPAEYALIDGNYHYTGKYELRTRSPHTDVDVCFGGQIAVSQISI